MYSLKSIYYLFRQEEASMDISRFNRFASLKTAIAHKINNDTLKYIKYDIQHVYMHILARIERILEISAVDISWTVICFVIIKAV